MHLRARRDATGDVAIDWIRRSRTGAMWGDADTPLGEESERYRVTINGGRTVETGMSNVTYTTTDQAADGVSAGATITIAVVQLGTLAASEAAQISFTL